MLHVFRESVGRYIAIAILGLIAVTFIFFGIDFSITQTSFAAKVNGESIPIREFDRELQRAQNQYQQLYREEMTDDLNRALRRDVIDRMVMREVLIQRAQDSGFRYSDARLADTIRNDEAFQVGGRFSPDVYDSRLAVEGLTRLGYEARQREQGAVLDLQSGVVESSFVTPAEFRRNVALYYEQRQIAWAAFLATDFLEGVAIGEEEIAAYYAENADRFQTEEAVDIELLELGLDDIAATVEVSEDDIRDYYETEIERYAVSEERHVRHILIEVEDEDYMEAEQRANAALERLEAGEDFAALAAELSDDAGTRNIGGDLGWMSRGMQPGPFEDALFAMEPGQVEGPVETEFGYHILKLDEVRAGDVQPYEAVRDELRSELAANEAYTEFYDRANEIANSAFETIDNLEAVATEYGLQLRRVDGLTRSRAPLEFVDPAPIVAVAFDAEAIATGENSDLIELGEDRVAVLRVAAHHLPEPRPLEQVTEDIRSILELEAAADRAADAATAFYDEFDAAAFAAGTLDAAALAATHGGSWNEATWIERDSTNVPAALLGPVFSQAKPRAGEPAVLRTPVGNGDQAIVVLTSVEPGQPENVPLAEREQGQLELANIAADIEINAYALDALAAARVRIPDEIIDPDL